MLPIKFHPDLPHTSRSDDCVLLDRVSKDRLSVKYEAEAPTNVSFMHNLSPIGAATSRIRYQM